MDIADRVKRVEPSATLAIKAAADRLTADGIDVADLSVGEPDFETPENIVTAGKQALEAGHTGYTATKGIRPLRAAIADSLDTRGLSYSPEQIVVTPGAKQALFEVIHAIVDPGDEVVVLDPAWVSYEAMVTLAGGQLTRVDLSATGFALEPALEQLAAAVTEETALVIVNSPVNPSGAVFSQAALEGLRDVVVDNDVAVLSDEIYDQITYDHTPTSLAALSGMADRTVTVNGFSKTYAMTGWRLGYYAGPEALVEQANKIQSHSVSCATNFVQRAGIEALQNTDAAVEEMVGAFEERRNLLVDLLADNGVDVVPPKGAFYLMLPVANDDEAWCETAIHEAHVATVPGSAFGTPGYARLSYAAGTDRIHDAVDRLAAAGLLG